MRLYYRETTVVKGVDRAWGRIVRVAVGFGIVKSATQ